MKINNFYNLNMDSLFLDSESKFFSEGTILEGEILEIEGKLAIIHIKDFGRIKAFVQMDLSKFKGKEINFLVKSSLPNKIELKPFYNNIEKEEFTEVIQREEGDYLINILNDYGIAADSESVEYLNTLIKYNVQINEKNILSGIKVLEKLEQLLNMQNDFATLINPKENSNLQKEDIRNLLIVSKDDGDIKLNQSKEETHIFSALDELKTYVRNFDEGKIKSDIIKIIALFVKYDIKPSINNIKYLLELMENPNRFSEDFEILEDIVDKKFTNIDKRTMINNGSFKNTIEENYVNYKQILEKIKEYPQKNLSIFDKNTKEKAKEIQDKIEFLEEMNQEIDFIYIPIFIDNEVYEGAITFLKDKKRKNNSNDKINIFINLNTHSLGNVTISCEVVTDTINIIFGGIHKEDIELFKNSEEKLKDSILNTSYILGTIKYVVELEDNLLDALTINTNPIYYLDVQV